MYLIDEIIVNKHELTIKINSKYRAYFEQDFWVKSDSLDFESIPEHILIIPFILNIAPVIWINNLTVILPSVDSSLEQSLAAIKSEMSKIYSDICWGGNITFLSAISSDQLLSNNDSICLLFSGGVDSLHASQELMDYKQLLVTLRGADIKLDDNEGWEDVKGTVKNYAKTINAQTFFIESNFADFINYYELKNKVRYVQNWWGNVQHAIGLAGFMALPACEYGVKNVAIASDLSVSQMQNLQWASISSLIESLAWSDCKIKHLGNSYTRQEKINNFVNKYRDSGNILPLRVCYESRGGKNCGKCRKCSLTMLNLLVAGVDYEVFGFTLPKKEFANKIKNNFFKLKYEITPVSLRLWEDMISNIKPRSDYLKTGFSAEILDMMDWLREFDIKSHAQKTISYAHQKLKFKQTVKAIPYIYIVFKLLQKLKLKFL